MIRYEHELSLQTSVAMQKIVAIVGDLSPMPKGIEITNAGGGILFWITESNALWLLANHQNGTGTSVIEISANHTNLQPGDYVGEITNTGTIRSDTVNNPQYVDANLTVLPGQNYEYL